MSDQKYFTRKINEGTVKRSHICSFDPTIKLEMLVQGSKTVLDFLLQQQANQATSKSNKSPEQINKAIFEATKEEFMRELSGLRINGLPIIYEQLSECFDGEEILEVVFFVNGADMSIFTGEPSTEKN